MAPILNNLLNDIRLSRLFSDKNLPCALQLWVLQIKCDNLVENRIVYGRLLPYSHDSQSWFFSDKNKYCNIDGYKIQITRLNLYVNSLQCRDLLKNLSTGQSLSSINNLMGFGSCKNLNNKFGDTALDACNLVYRPVSYLLNRDAYDLNSISSPHGAAGVLSASISQSNKKALFCLDNEYSTALTTLVVERLNIETGLDFGREDIKRFGDIELLVFPTLNDFEQNLLKVKWIDSSNAFSVIFDPIQVSYFDKFQFHLSIANDGQIISSTIASANCNEKGVFEYVFQVAEGVRKRIDSTELAIFGFQSGSFDEGVLCCRWRISYIREINFQSTLMRQEEGAVKFDWLEKTTKPAMSARVKAALTVSYGHAEDDSYVGGRKADPWVLGNRQLKSLFSQLHPAKSDGQFFQRWSMGDGEGRLQFVEWFRTLLDKYKQHQIVIFDPYFDIAGLGLVSICAVMNSDYLVFTSLPKLSDESRQDEGKHPISGRVNNLIASCEHNSNLLNRIKFRIYGLREGRLHDRYILINGADNLPIAGFHLSNSFQKAAENYPLLITPIPMDVLLQVEQYKCAMVKEAMTTSLNSETENPIVRLLFDSTKLPSAQQRYEPLRFLEKSNAGSVLSIWSGETSLKDLSGDLLKTQMTALGILKDNSLLLTDGLKNCVNKREINSNNFVSIWEVLGEILAHSSINDTKVQFIESESDFLEFLSEFLKASFERVHDNMDKELDTLDVRLFHEPVEILLYSSYRIDQLFKPTKYTALTWPEYFAIRFLWWYAPDCLLRIAETQISILPLEAEAVRLSLLSQIVSEISLSIQVNISKIQRDSLIHRNQGLLKWLGLNAIKQQLYKPRGFKSVLLCLKTFSHKQRVLTLGWMVNHVAMDANKKKIYEDLVAALYEELPEAISIGELRYLVDCMRGHMKPLAWAEPWLFQDVVFPLLQSERVATESACDIWMQELASMLQPVLNNASRLFDRAREGQTTNIASFLFASSSLEQRESSLTIMNNILKQQRRIVYQPLASTSNWTQWDDALRVSLWILAFGRWSEFYLRECDVTDQNLEQLSQDAYELAMIRPIEEWRSERVGEQDELVAFLDQVEGLLSTDGKLK